MTLADGCFDPLHVGHLRYLRAARRVGRPLIVRVAPDDAIRAKGHDPFQIQQERAGLIWALDCVDRVVFDDSLAEAVCRLRPDHLVKGIDWRDRLPDDVLRACQQTGTRIVFVNTPSLSSTDRLRRCLMPLP